jgi:subtilisin family serine protease
VQGNLTKSFPEISQEAKGELVLITSDPAKISTSSMQDTLSKRPDVVYAEPDYIQVPVVTPNDPMFPSLWGLENTGQTVNGVTGVPHADINAPPAWDLASASPQQTVVAVIDTGVDYTHEDLSSQVWLNPGEIPNNGIDDDGNGYVDDVHGIDAFEHDNDPMDGDIHGTHVAGTIAALGNNGLGVAGVVWNTDWNLRIIPCRFLGPTGGATSGAIECLNYIQKLKNTYGVNIVATNNSWGGGKFSQALSDAISANGSAGILFVAAAGNSSRNIDSTPFYPASYASDHIIAVAATTQADGLASFSNYGATSVDVGAPGVNILSTATGGGGYDPSQGDTFFDNMESGAVNWTATGIWAITSEKPKSGFSAWSDSPGKNYSNNSNTGIVSRAIDLRALAVPLRLGFHADIALEQSYDFLYIEISRDGGNKWSSLAGLTGTRPYAKYVFPIPDPYKTSNFRVRFRLVTDASVTKDGVYVDDVGIGTGSGSANYQYLNGTSMATPHVTGLAALMASQSASLSSNRLKSAILQSGDLVASLRGKTLTGRRVDAFNALSQIGGGGNKPPIANAGPDQTVASGSVVTLDGSGSSDPDGTITSYAWTQTAGPSVTLSDPSAVKPTFTAPTVSANTVLTFRLTVTDDDGATATAQVNVTVIPPAVNQPPIANAGPDQTVVRNSIVTLDGSGSRDPDGTIVSYLWTQLKPSSPRVTLSDPNAVRPTFRAPYLIMRNTVFTFQLTVTDNAGAKASDQVNVTVTLR